MFDRNRKHVKEEKKMSFDLDLKLPGPEALAVAEKELRETEENVKDALAKLRTYLEGEFSF